GAPGLDLNGVQPSTRSNASRNSRTTSGSVSRAARARTASRAGGEPIRPSAHATCARTSGSGSSSAAASAGTSSSDPTLPNATAAFRLSPGSFARVIAEPLNAARYAISSIASTVRAIDRASRPANASRAANAGSSTARANFSFQGQTSWQMSQP